MSHAAVRRASSLKAFRYTCVERARRSELRRADANTGTVAQFIGAIERVHHHQACVEIAEERPLELMDDCKVELRVERHMVRVRKTAAQAGAEERIRGVGRARIGVRNAG